MKTRKIEMAHRLTLMTGRAQHAHWVKPTWRTRAGVAACLTGVVVALVSVVGGALPAGATVPSTGWTQISTGGEHTCALATGGVAYCWGLDAHGELGNGTTGTDSAVPVAVTVPAGVAGWFAISTGESHTCALTLYTEVAYCWGANAAGQLGNGGTGTDSNVPVAVTVPSGVTGWTKIAAGDAHTCAVALATADAYCWGSNGAGQLGNGGPGTDSGVPVAVTVPGGFPGWFALTGGANHTCGISMDADALCWGSNILGQLGNNQQGTDSGVPVAVVLPAGELSWSQISAGGNHTCAIGSSSVAYCWGTHGFGQGGWGSVGNFSAVPFAVTVPSGVTLWSGLSVGTYHSCALDMAGVAYCWGLNDDGELGNDDAGTNQNVPVAVNVPSGVSGWDSIAGGDGHTCALATTTGAAYCWGGNSQGELGDDDQPNAHAVPDGVSQVAQTITFTAPPSTELTAGPVDVSGDVSASSGLTVTVTSTSTSVCTVTGMSVTLVSVGTCALTATQPGDGLNAAAAPVDQSFTVTAPATTTTTTASTTTAPATTAIVPASTSTTVVAVVSPSTDTTPSDDSLPRTGAPLAPVTGGALALIGIGVVLIAQDRRRTHRAG